jgi:hypothetical protein
LNTLHRRQKYWLHFFSSAWKDRSFLAITGSFIRLFSFVSTTTAADDVLIIQSQS